MGGHLTPPQNKHNNLDDYSIKILKINWANTHAGTSLVNWISTKSTTPPPSFQPIGIF